MREVTPPWIQRLCTLKISTHTSREGSDGTGSSLIIPLSKFQPTLPVREVTIGPCYPLPESINFNPHFPWGKWPTLMCVGFPLISFQPTLPVREVTLHWWTFLGYFNISTHTSREGSDLGSFVIAVRFLYFNPHFPWGKWRIKRPFYFGLNQFQPTLPVREVTVYALYNIK